MVGKLVERMEIGLAEMKDILTVDDLAAETVERLVDLTARWMVAWMVDY